MRGHRRSKNGVTSFAFARASTPCHGKKTWMAGTSPAMTEVGRHGTHPRPRPSLQTLRAIVIANDIDLALDEGEALGIIGPNGAGKDHPFGIMTGTVAADAGRVLYAGQT